MLPRLKRNSVIKNKMLDQGGMARLVRSDELRDTLSHINVGKLEHLLIIWTEIGGNGIHLATSNAGYKLIMSLLLKALYTIKNAPTEEH